MRKGLVALVLAQVLVMACPNDDDLPLADGGADGPPATEDGGTPEVCETLLPTSFAKDTVLERDCYLCKQTPQIADGVKITMAPGVKIVFSPQTGLEFTADQVLIAVGTASAPIVLTGAKKERGYWEGLRFEGTLKPDSKLDYVVIEYAGDTSADRDAAALRASADSRGVRFSMTHTTLRQSEGWGLFLGGAAVVGAFGNNTLTENKLGPAYVYSEVVSTLDGASTYAGNDRDELYVKAYTTEGTWAALDVPYYVEGAVLRPEGDWTIEAGTTLIMAKDVEVEVADDDNALIARGTAAKPILFTGAVKQRGGWDGITFNNSNNKRNALAFVTVEYAGSTTSDKDAAGVKLTADSSGVQLSMSDTTVRRSQGWGLFLAGSSVLPAFAGNKLTENTLGPVSAASEAVHQLLPTSSYSGNDVDLVVVQGGYVSHKVTWQDLKVPYLLRGYLRPNKAILTFGPGLELLMAKDAWIEVSGDDAGLHAVGTSAAPITITGQQKTAGYWQSIVFDTSLNGANALDHCEVAYGGGGKAKGWNGMIVVQSDSHGVSASMQNSKIQNSAVYGIWQGKYASLSLTGTTYANNASGNLYKQP